MNDSNTYGEWSTISGHDIPEIGVDHVLGGHLQSDSKGRPDWVDIQFKSADGEPVQRLKLDIENALVLCSILNAIKIDAATRCTIPPRPEPPRWPV